MSTAETGDAGFTRQAMDSAKAVVASAMAEEAEQLQLDVSPTPEDIAEAREKLGAAAGNLSVLREAREIRRGRPPGAKNKRTDDFTKWLLSFGSHPARTLMEVASAPPEVLIENSKRKVTRMSKSGNLVEYYETMSYSEANALRLRAAEALMPYFESKKPVAIDATIRGVRVVEEIGGPPDRLQQAIEGDFVRVMRDIDGEEAA